MKAKEKILFWIGLLVILGIMLYAVKAILLPFVVAIIVAYFLDPAVDRLENIGVSRWLGTLLMIVMFFSVMITLSLILVPILYEQLLSFLQKIPEYTHRVQERLLPSIAHFIEEIDPNAIEKIKSNAGNASAHVMTFIVDVLTGMWSSGVAILSLISLLFVTPIVIFYLLRDWDKIIAMVDGLLPQKHAKTIREQCRRIDDTLSGYLRGQVHVCMLLGAFYAIGLMAVGLEFGLIIGLMTGILSFIPYVGMLFGVVIGLGIAFVQFGGLDGLAQIGAVTLIFAIGQFAEGNFVTPKLVGSKVGLHPAWVMFALLAGGAVMGVLGVLIAVPMAAIIGVLIRFAVEQYLESSLYKEKKVASKVVSKKKKVAKA